MDFVGAADAVVVVAVAIVASDAVAGAGASAVVVAAAVGSALPNLLENLCNLPDERFVH